MRPSPPQNKLCAAICAKASTERSHKCNIKQCPMCEILAMNSAVFSGASQRTACFYHQRLQKELAADDLHDEGPGIPENGEAGIGDPLFPTLGNDGYDAKHYDIKLEVDQRGHIDGSSSMKAVADKPLTRFNLDFRGFEVESVSVNGQQARFSRDDGELVVTPKSPLSQGAEFEVKVDYNGMPRAYNSPHAPVTLGWNRFRDGSYVVSQPDGASSWFPVNDHPRDRASYDFELTVPKPYTAVANGVLQQTTDNGDSQTFHWKAEDEMASYLATVHVGDYVRREDEGPGGLKVRHYFPSDIADVAERDFERVPEMLEFFSNLYGEYPFKVYGGIVMDTQIGGAALETQTLPLYERGMVTGGKHYETVFVHELAHQWFGDSITLENWQDIWLNEGFATYSQWLWDERNHGRDALERQAESVHRRLRRAGGPPVAKPSNRQLFSGKVYMQGGLTLHALRRKVGDEDFFNIVRTYFGEFKGKTATTDDFVEVASRVSGQDLEPFFQEWLYSNKLPDLPQRTDS